MKRYVKSSIDVFGMTTLSAKYADVSRVGIIDKFIYFSQAVHSSGPRIKFYGGTKETEKTRNAPSYTFTSEGPGNVILQPWMNKKNCPNAYDEKYLEAIEYTINKMLPLLLLVWYDKLDDSDVLKYAYGEIDLKDVLYYIDCEKEIYEVVQGCDSLDQLHQICLKYNLYSF